MVLAFGLSPSLGCLRARLAIERPATQNLIRSIRDQKLTYVSRHKMRRCALALEMVRNSNVPGCYIEAGVALGGSAILIAKLRQAGRALKLFDVFGMIPAPSEDDDSDAHNRYEVIRSGRSEGIDGQEYYGYHENLMTQVVKNLAGYGLDTTKDQIELIPGTFEDHLFLSEPVAFAHIDCDWYGSVTTCIERIFPVLSPGGIMVFDDYQSYSGCRKAVDKFLASRSDVTIVFAGKSIGLQKKK